MISLLYIYTSIEFDITLLIEALNDNLEAQAYALYRDWFIESGSKHGATNCVLGDLISIYDFKRIPLSSQERAQRSKLYRYFGAAGLLDYVDEFIYDGIYLLVGEDGSVINDEGFPYLQYVNGKFWVNNHAHILQGTNGASTELIYLTLLKTNIKEYVTGAVQAKLSQENLRLIPAITLSGDELSKFDALIQPLFALMRQNNAEVDCLSLLKDNLLSKLASSF